MCLHRLVLDMNFGNMKRMLGKTRKQRGFTLIEMLLYVAVAGIVLTSLVGFGWNMIGIGAKNGTHHDAVSNARLASEKLTFFIREATDIDTANSNFGVNLASVSGSKVTLRGVAPNDPIVFDVSSGTLRVMLGASAPIALVSDNISVSSLVFANASSLNGKSKNVGFTLQLGTTSGSGRFEYASSTALRSSAEIRSNSL